MADGHLICQGVSNNDSCEEYDHRVVLPLEDVSQYQALSHAADRKRPHFVRSFRRFIHSVSFRKK